MNMMRRTLSVVLAAALVLPTAAWAASSPPALKDALLDALPMYELHTLAGSGVIGLVDGPNKQAAFRQPISVLGSANGNIIAADSGNQRIRQITPTTTSTRGGNDLGEDEHGYLIGTLNDGDKDSALFQGVAGLATGSNGSIVAADAGNHAIRELSAQGRVTTIAGDGVQGLADGSDTEARFNHPLDVAVTQSGIIYVADTLNHVIRKIEQGKVSTLTAPSTRIIEYFPGAVEAVGDYADGPIASAKFNEPSGLALDSRGNLYVSDTGNQLIRYINFAAGTVKTVAGSKAAYTASDAYAEGGYADGPAADARFHSPRGLSLTPEGGLLVADALNHSIRYLKDGSVHTVAGTPEESSKADGLAGYSGLNVPTDIAPIGNGAYAIADSANNKIRVLAPYSQPAGLTADGKIKIVHNQTLIATDAAPVIKNGTTFVPVRVIAEKLGYTVDFQGSGAVTVSRDNLVYSIGENSTTVKRTGGDIPAAVVTLNAAPFISEDRLFLPVRFFAEEISLDVQWLPSVKTVLLRDRIQL